MRLGSLGRAASAEAPGEHLQVRRRGPDATGIMPLRWLRPGCNQAPSAGCSCGPRACCPPRAPGFGADCPLTPWAVACRPSASVALPQTAHCCRIGSKELDCPDAWAKQASGPSALVRLTALLLLNFTAEVFGQAATRHAHLGFFLNARTNPPQPNPPSEGGLALHTDERTRQHRQTNKCGSNVLKLISCDALASAHANSPLDGLSFGA